MGIFLYRSHCRRAILLVPRSISARVILYIFIALMCLRVSAASSYSVIMITLSAIISLNKLSVSFSLSSSETQIICKLFLFVVSHRSYGTSLVAQMMKILSAMQDIRVLSLGWDDPLEKGMGTHSSVLVWRIPWTEEPGGLQSIITKELDMTEAAKHTMCFEPQGPLSTEALPLMPCPCRVWGSPYPGGKQPLL